MAHPPPEPVRGVFYLSFTVAVTGLFLRALPLLLLLTQCDRVPEAVGRPSDSTAVAAPRCVSPTPATPPRPTLPLSVMRCPRVSPALLERLPTAIVTFPDALEGRTVFEVELAVTSEQKQQGLMFRTAMAEGAGMFFRLGSRQNHAFWMHNTCIPLDMMFVDDDGLIVGIVEYAQPLDDESRDVGCPSVWVIEANGGWARRHGVRAGQHIDVPSALRTR